jgi:class 3 adenylate cyclase
MNTETSRRKLAGILSTDMVGFSRLMNENETRTLRNLKECREIIKKSITSHYGRIFGTAGDSFLAEFGSTVDAVKAAIEFQTALDKRNLSKSAEDQVLFRVGINLGDVIVEGNNLFGEGVNIAARLEPLALHGGICISKNVFSEVRKRLTGTEFTPRGPITLKNISEPMEVFDLILNTSPAPKKIETPIVTPINAPPKVAPVNTSSEIQQPEYSKEMKHMMLYALKDPDVAFQLGYAFENGEGTTQNYTEAIRWYTMAANNGNSGAQFNLAMIFEEGRGTPVNLQKAFYWCTKAADQGEVAAQYNLGLFLAEGKGCHEDLIQSHMWFSLASMRGDKDALSNRNTLAKRLKPQELNESKKLALEWIAQHS